MQFQEWEPVYEAILRDMGYDRRADERARDRLAELLPDEPYDPSDLDFEGKTVAVAGAAPTLTEELTRAREADAVIAASGAAAVLSKHGVGVDCMVTDLDGPPGTATTLARTGTPVAVHAHGDNLSALETVVPELPSRAVLPTTQARPANGVYNFGGFTDGDRAAFLADACGAGGLVFPGWAFDDPTVGREKRRKLAWAERLLYWLERRRGERFALLDGRRDGLTTPGRCE